MCSDLVALVHIFENEPFTFCCQGSFNPQWPETQRIPGLFKSSLSRKHLFIHCHNPHHFHHHNFFHHHHHFHNYQYRHQKHCNHYRLYLHRNISTTTYCETIICITTTTTTTTDKNKTNICITSTCVLPWWQSRAERTECCWRCL